MCLSDNVLKTEVKIGKHRLLVILVPKYESSKMRRTLLDSPALSCFLLCIIVTTHNHDITGSVTLHSHSTMFICMNSFTVAKIR